MRVCGSALRANSLPVLPTALVLFGATFLLLDLVIDTPALHADTARDLLTARDCVDVGRCAMAGPTSSFGGVIQGALWIHFLEMSRAAGLGLRGIRAGVLALTSASSVLIAFTPRRLCRWNGGPAAWAIMLAASAGTIELPILWNPSALPLPIALFHVALLACAATGSVPAAGAVGVALSLSIDAHLVSAAWTPFAVVVVVATAVRPFLAMSALSVLLVGTSLLSSFGAVRDDVALLGAVCLYGPVVLVVALGLGWTIRRRMRAVAPASRVRAVLVAACTYFVLCAIGMCVAKGHALAPRYFAPIVPAAAILGSGAAVGWRAVGGRRGAVGNAAVVFVVGVAGAALTLLHSPASRPSWTAEDAESLAGSLSSRGWTFAALHGHLRGPQANELLAGLAPFLPAPDGAPLAPAQDDLLLFKVSGTRARASDAEKWIVADLPGNAVAVGRRAASWLDVGWLEVCAGFSGSDARCMRTSLDGGDPDRGEKGTVSQRAYPELANARSKLLSDGRSLSRAFRWTVEVRLRPNPEGPAHVLTLADPEPLWRIERIDGALYQGLLPGREVVLESVPTEGRILFGVDVSADDAGRFRPWLPSFVETAAGEEALRSLFANPTRGSP